MISMCMPVTKIKETYIICIIIYVSRNHYHRVTAIRNKVGIKRRYWTLLKEVQSSAIVQFRPDHLPRRLFWLWPESSCPFSWLSFLSRLLV
jgi:hypothetical protein